MDGRSRRVHDADRAASRGTSSAALAVSPGSGLAPLQVSADASGSTDTDATPIATYDFAWGDGTPATGPQPGSAAQHTFASPGSYTVTVTVKDTAGLSSTATQSIAANSDLAPTPALSVTPNPVAVQFPVQADASRSKDTDGTPIATYSFSWGDGTPATGPQSSSTAQHTYAAVGSFKVKVTLKDTGGLSSTATKAVTVSPDAAPVAKLRVTKSSSNPMQITADGSTSTDTDATPIGSYRFDFGDGTAVVTTHAPSAKATHTYANAGTFTVTLTVLDTAGNASAPVTASVFRAIRLSQGTDTTTMRPALIRVRGVAKSYATADGDVESLKPLEFDIHEGEFISVVGPSGCGKSTLLKLIGGLCRPSSGIDHIAGNASTGPRTESASSSRATCCWPGERAREHHAADRGAQLPREPRSTTAPAMVAMVGLERLREQAIPGSSPAACSSAPRSAARWCTIRRSC